MTGVVTAVIWAGAAGLVVAAGLRIRRELRERTGRSGGAGVDDDAVRRILDDGVYSIPEEEEPLDLEAIEDEERRFWTEERWDEADEW